MKKASTVSSGRMVLVATVKVKTRPSGRSLQWCRSRLDNDETRFGK